MEQTDWFEKCRVEVEQGNAEKQYKLGMYYEFGCGVDEDLDEALRWYPGGDFDAMNSLGVLSNDIRLPHVYI